MKVLAVYSLTVSLIFVVLYDVAPDIAEALTILFVAAIVIPAIANMRGHNDRAS